MRVAAGVRSFSLSRRFPREFGRYRLTALLGSGGTAEVYRAETQPVAGISRTVAIKRIMAGFVRGDTAILDETRIWVKLNHPNIVSVIDFGEEDGDWFVALELVEGVTASELVKCYGALPYEEALTIIERLAKGLHYAHTLVEDGVALKLIHRDVKPANILVSTRGEVKLTDFGIARAANRQSRTATGILKGSLSTLSPEQVREEPLDHRADLFALGATLHNLLTGAPLFDLSLERLLLQLEKNEIPEPPKDLPPKIRQLLAALTSADKEKRPATANDVAKAIRLILAPTSPDDIEPILAKKARMAREKLDRERPPDRPSRASSPSNPAAAAVTDSDLGRSTAKSGERVADSNDDMNRTTSPSRERAAAPDDTGDTRRSAEAVKPDLPRIKGPDDERTSDDLGALLPKDDLPSDVERGRPPRRDMPMPPPMPAKADDSTEIGPRAAAPPRREPSGPSTPTVPRPADPPSRSSGNRPRPPPIPPPGAETEIVPQQRADAARPADRRSRSSNPGGAPAVSEPPAAVKIIRPEESFELPMVVPPPRSERTMTGRLLVAVASKAPRLSKKALAVFALAVAVIAMVAVPQVQSYLSLSRCESAPARLEGDLGMRDALSIANEARELMAGCPPNPALLDIRLRALAYAGDTKGARSLLPPAAAANPDEQLVHAGLHFVDREYRQAEEIAKQVAAKAPAARAAGPACLAAAAAINQDEPGRADAYLAKVNGDCVRVLRAAAEVQRGDLASALAHIKTAPSGVDIRAAHESALGTIHLQKNDQDAADADARSATSEARHNALQPHPYIWYTTHNPRGGASMSLRVTGPMDDPVLYALLLAGDAARSRGNLDLAAKLYDEAAARTGRTAIAEVRAATILKDQGKPQRAVGRLTRAISLDPTFAPAYVQLALLTERDDPAAAVEYANSALKLQPENRDARRIAGR